MQFNKFELDQSQNNHIIEAAAAAEIQSLNMIKCGAINTQYDCITFKQV